MQHAHKDRARMRHFAQNFLQDPKIAMDIVSAARLTKEDTVLEIGPGDGALTLMLADEAKKVIAIEKDGSLVPTLFKHTRPYNNTTIIQADIMTYDYRGLFPEPVDGISDFVVVSNLPYNVGTPVLQMLVSGQTRPKRIVAMVQKEVAERIAAKAPNMSLLSLTVQWFADVQLLFSVRPEAFSPRPKVMSQVFELIPKPLSKLPQASPREVFRLAKLGFSQKRKKLANNLSHALSLPKETVEKLLIEEGLTASSRAEELSLENWLRIAEKVKHFQ